ncbi:MAG: type II toxin-antitoxin system VapC family toxin [Actinobacteria bacterium]|nr:type II toxin-antitoxin system VapC family toxin [Actinomycetota bacterium]
MIEIKNSNVLIDTDIIIDHLRGIGNFSSIVDNTSNNECYISVISIAEVYSNLFPHEYEIMEMLLSELKIVNIDPIIAKLAGNYRMKFYKSHGLRLPDAIIAATAKINDAILVTKNVKHYPMEDIQKITPY